MDHNQTSAVLRLIDFVQQYILSNPGCSKESLVKATADHLRLTKKGSVYFCDQFAVRFSSASGSSFSNVVLSLSTLQQYDSIPFIVCVVRPTSIELLLANSTFLKKISHSSQQLRIDNIRGSFLGHDILRVYEDLPNIPGNFQRLFAMHEEFTWEENVGRLVEATTNIIPTGTRFVPTAAQESNILLSAELAAALSNHDEYLAIGTTLQNIVNENYDDILQAGRINNVNIRGNTIEQIITQAANLHSAEDLSYTLNLGSKVMVDIKTKILTLTSSPKGYNIDKLLMSLCNGNTVFSFFFVGMDLETNTINTRLISIFDHVILKATRIQFHWAGRRSRGVTQLTGDFKKIFDSNYPEIILIEEAQQFLQRLLDINPQ